jgi:hypothetical protein
MMCDLLYLHLQGWNERHIQERHQETILLFDLLAQVCSHPEMLKAWYYQDNHQQWLVQRLGPVVGANRTFIIQTPNDVAEREGLGRSVEAPFLPSVMCALVSQEFRLLPLAHMLAGAARGWWIEQDTVFWVDAKRSARVRIGPFWQVMIPPLCDLGQVVIVFQGSEIISLK